VASPDDGPAGSSAMLVIIDISDVEKSTSANNRLGSLAQNL
jgi:hypothetical protein